MKGGFWGLNGDFEAQSSRPKLQKESVHIKHEFSLGTYASWKKIPPGNFNFKGGK